MTLINQFKSLHQIWKSKLFLITVALLTLIATTYKTYIHEKDLANLELASELEKKSRVIGKTILNPIERALNLGIDLHDLRGVEEHFQNLLDDNPALTGLSLTDKHGKVLFKRLKEPNNITANENFENTITLRYANEEIGSLKLTLDLEPFKQSHLEILVQIMIILTAASIFLYEFVNYFLNHYIQEPTKILHHLMARMKKGDFTEKLKLNTKDEISSFSEALSKLSKRTANLHHKMISIGKIQAIIHEESQEEINKHLEKLNSKFKFAIPIKKLDMKSLDVLKIQIFLFAFTEALANSFIVFFAAELQPQNMNAPLPLILSLPVALYMFGYAFSIPAYNIFNQLTNNFSPRIVGGLLYCSGSLGSALSYSFFDFTPWRMLSGLGFGILMMSYSFINKNENQYEQSDEKNSGFFITGFYGGYLCGMPIGALLALNIGYKLAFFIISLLSLLLVTIGSHPRDNNFSFYAHKHQSLLKNLIEIMLNPKVRNLWMFISFPSRFIVGNCLLFFVPFYCYSMNVSLLWVGLILGFYVLPIYLISRFYSILLNKISASMLLLIGQLLVCFSGVFLFLSDVLHGLFLLALILGLGHSLSLNSQDNLLKPIKADSNMYSAFRFLELLGLPLGAVSMGILLSHFDSVISVNFVLVIHAVCLVLFTFFSYKRNNLIAHVES